MIGQTPPARQDMPAGNHAARRTHLMTEMATRHRVVPRRRLLIGGMATAGLAGGLAAVMIIAPTTEVGGGTPRAQAAAEILTRAADTAAAQPDLKPRRDQYVYVESKSRQGDMPGQPGSSNHRKVWLPVDGDRAGLLISEGDSPAPAKIWLCGNEDQSTDGSKPVEKLPAVVDLAKPPRNCGQPSAYRKNLPTDPAAMRKWLYRNSAGSNPPDKQAFTTIGDTLRETYIPPAALAAMFRAAAKIPGVTVTPNAVDSAGRKGIAVGQTWHGSRNELIFDPKTYALLGEREVVDYDNAFRPSGGSTPDTKPWVPSTQQKQNMKQGTVIHTTATLKMAITDKVAQQP